MPVFEKKAVFTLITSASTLRSQKTRKQSNPKESRGRGMTTITTEINKI